jgi:hypothetical protein
MPQYREHDRREGTDVGHRFVVAGVDQSISTASDGSGNPVTPAP